MTQPSPHAHTGTIVAVHGFVVDVSFADSLPPINTLLRAGTADGGIALPPTQGLARGIPVKDTGCPLADGAVDTEHPGIVLVENAIGVLPEDLNGRFHHLRQSTIDEELFDVASGFEALTNHRQG